MHWIDDYQLFLFDFDGILVNTEELHYLAYKKMCADRGVTLHWDMPTYIHYAMYSSDGLKKGLYRDFPALDAEWDVLYKEKKAAYEELLVKQGAALMPGVEELLKALEQADCKRCVVTHSNKAQTTLLRQKQPILDTIPHWITREDYTNPKPSSDCYQLAIAKLGKAGDRIIGFEDSPRGLKALLGSGAEGVLVTELFSREEVSKLGQEIGREFAHVPTFHELFAHPVYSC